MPRFTITATISPVDIEDPTIAEILEDSEHAPLLSKTYANCKLTAEIKANTPEAALAEFRQLASQAGLVIRAYQDEVFSISDLAERLGRTRESIRLYAKHKRLSGFPEPFSTTSSTPLWHWAEVREWLDDHPETGITLDNLYDDYALPPRLITLANSKLSESRPHVKSGYTSNKPRPDFTTTLNEQVNGLPRIQPKVSTR